MSRWVTPLIAGIAVIFLAQVLYVAVLAKVSFHEPLRLLLLGAPGLAALVTAYLAPGPRVAKVAVGVGVALMGALIGVVSSGIYRSLGFHVDEIGGPVATLLILLAYNGIVGLLGAALGAGLSGRARPA